MKVDTLTPVLDAAPGERATCRLRIENTESAPLAYRLRVIGFDDAQVLRPPPTRAACRPGRPRRWRWTS